MTGDNPLKAFGVDTLKCNRVIDRRRCVKRFSLAALILCDALLSTTMAPCANDTSSRDSGPKNAIMAIRHDLPLLLADPLSYEDARPVVDMVVTDGYEAVATWHARNYRGLVILYHDDDTGKWWWHAATSSDSDTADAWAPVRMPGQLLSHCDMGLPGPPSGHDLFMAGLVSRYLLAKSQPAQRAVTIQRN